MWEEKLLEEAFPSLLQEFPLTSDVPGGMPEYRKSLILSFFLKYFLSVKKQLPGIEPILFSCTYTGFLVLSCLLLSFLFFSHCL